MKQDNTTSLTFEDVDYSAKLAKFLDAQRSVYDQVLRELMAGRKETHWIWFIFPQLSGLGSSEMSRRFGIDSKAEARNYLGHPVLGSRLKECTRLVLAIPARDVGSIMGHPDDLKFRSCMTLFAVIAPEESIFRDVLDKFYAGELDPLTVALLESGDDNHNYKGNVFQ